MTHTIRVPRHVVGYRGVAFGGYVAGVLARPLGASADVRLKAPVPPETDLTTRAADGGVALVHDGAVLAEAVHATLDDDPPSPVSLDDAHAASRAYLGRTRHPFSRCFGCGPDAPGLRVFPGPLPDGRRVAAAWTPRAVAPADAATLAWCALDCPGSWLLWSTGVVPLDARLLTGRLAVAVHAPVTLGAPHVVVAEHRGGSGRAFFVSTGLFAGDDGRLVAHGRATWVTPSG